MVKSETVEYVFTVKEGGRGQPFIACEPRGGELSILGKHSFLSLHLDRAVTFSETQDIANYLNDNIEGVSVTQTSPNWMLYGRARLATQFPKMFTRLRQLWLTH